MSELSQGKLQGMHAVSDERGVIRAAAMDQRGSLKRALSKELGVDKESISAEMMAEFKAAVIRVLSPYASGVLLDPEYGIEASRQRHQGVGLLLARERSGYDNTQPGRIPLLLEEWPVPRLKEAGADCVKLLIYYTPFDEPSINETKQALVRGVGDACRESDIPFFLEFVGYDHTGAMSPLEYARRKPEVVAESMREFSRDEYGVDVLKVEIPVDLKFTSGTESFQGGEAAYSREEALDLYHKAADVARRPFIYLSAGVSDAQFRESLRLAVESGVHFCGVLCGRATWKDGIPVYASQGIQALEDWLSDRGVKNIQALNEILKQAHSWETFYSGQIA